MTGGERSFLFRYRTTLPAELLGQGEVEVWIPLPNDDPFQQVRAVEVSAPVQHEIASEPKFGNRMAHLRVPRADAPATIAVSYEITRRERLVPLPAPQDYPSDFDTRAFQPHLAPNANVPVDGFIGYQARLIGRRTDPPVVRARKIFDYLLATLDYDWVGCTPDRFHQLGDLQKACDLRKGTCTEFHGLFVGYARALGMPAKFCFGFNVAAGTREAPVAGYHCWAEVFLPGAGWFPVDVSEAFRARAKGGGEAAVDFFFGGLNPDRFQLTTGRDLGLAPQQSANPVDKLIFSYCEQNGESVEAQLEFGFVERPQG